MSESAMIRTITELRDTIRALEAKGEPTEAGKPPEPNDWPKALPGESLEFTKFWESTNNGPWFSVHPITQVTLRQVAGEAYKAASLQPQVTDVKFDDLEDVRKLRNRCHEGSAFNRNEAGWHLEWFKRGYQAGAHASATPEENKR